MFCKGAKCCETLEWGHGVACNFSNQRALAQVAAIENKQFIRAFGRCSTNKTENRHLELWKEIYDEYMDSRHVLCLELHFKCMIAYKRCPKGMIIVPIQSEQSEIFIEAHQCDKVELALQPRSNFKIFVPRHNLKTFVPCISAAFCITLLGMICKMKCVKTRRRVPPNDMILFLGNDETESN